MASDYIIRKELKKHLLKKNDHYLIDEFPIFKGLARIDLLKITDKFIGYEIKSDTDTLRRLDYQIKKYSFVFDYIYVVTTNKFLSKMESFIPEYVGLYLFDCNDDKNNIRLIKKAKKNKNIDIYSIAQLLWKVEALEYLKSFKLSKGLSNKSRDNIIRVIEDNSQIEELKKFTIKSIKIRKGNQADSLHKLYDDSYQLESIPCCLR